MTDNQWIEIAGGILIRWHDGEPEMKTSDGQIIESVDIEQSLKGTKVTNLVIARSKLPPTQWQRLIDEP